MSEARFSPASQRALDPGSSLGLAFAAARGDSEATTRLVRALSPRVTQVVRLVLGGAHPDVDDAIQQSLIGFVQALPAFRGDCDPAGYASKIAVRTAVTIRKRARALGSRRDDGADADAMPASRACPNEAAASHRRKELLRELLADLPEEQAEALAMRVVLGWSLEEIAASSGAPLNTVRSRLRIAKEALKKRIEANPALVEELGVR